MKKILKITAKVAGVLVLVVLVALLVLPVMFKGKIMEIAREEANKAVDATVDFEDIRLSMFRHFPYLTVGMEGLSVVGHEPFAGDTLMRFRTFSVSVDPFGLLGDKGIEIRQILLDGPEVYAVVLEDGRANWDIVPEDTTVVETVEEDTTSSEMPAVKVQLKSFRIREGRIVYDDRQGHMKATLGGVNFFLRGRWSGSRGTLFTETTLAAVDVMMDGIRYLRQAKMRFTATLDADLDKGVYTFRENEFAVNDLVLGFDGTVAMPGDSIVTDISFATKETSFKSLLSMVPAIYMNDFAELRTQGTLALNGRVKGVYYEKDGDTLYPGAVLILQVKDASFAYPDLPEQVKEVNIDVKVVADGTHPDNTTIDVNRFAWKLGENPFRAELHVKHPVSDPEVKGGMVGRIDLGTLNQALALDSTEMSGVITTDLKIAGTMSMIEQERYEEFTADGSVRVKGVKVVTPMMQDPVEVPEGTMLFSPRYVDLQGLKMVIGPSDMAFSGRVENFIPYLFDKGTVKGTLAFSSHHLDLNRLMPVEETADDTLAALPDTVVSDTSIVEVPANVDFLLTARMDEVVYGNLTARRVGGKIHVKDRKVFFDGLAMEAMGGRMTLDGVFSTVHPEQPAVEMKMTMQEVSIPEVYRSFVTVKQLLPYAKEMKGTVSTEVTFSTILDGEMMPVLNTLDASGRVRSRQVTLVSQGVFEKIRKTLKMSESYTNELKDVNLSFRIEKGRLQVQPFKVKMGDVEMTVSGEQGLDRSIDYLLDMKIPRRMLGKAANEVAAGLLAKAGAAGVQAELPEVIPVKAHITGTLQQPKIGLGAGKAGSGSRAVKEAVKEKAKEEVQKQVEKVEQKVDEEKEKLKAKADARAEALLKEAARKRDEAIAAAEKERDKMLKKADEIEKNAEGTFAQKMKARAEAKALRKAARKAYEKAVKLANEQYKKAEQKAEEIRNSVKEL